MSGGIYLRRGRELIAMTERPYPSEDELQEMLADHPGLLAGDQVEGAPSRWVLLSREAGLASEEAGGGRWSVDHLFADQDGVPTLVEVKLSSDTRIRREVVGQLLEYAANAVVYWPLDELRGSFEATCRERGAEPTIELERLLGEGADPEGWWAEVEANLRLGRLRLVFVADRVGRELARIVEFLNEQMTRTEVLAVEVRQYGDEDGEHRTVVPRLIGQTEAARGTKVRPGRRNWDEESLLADLRRRRGAEEAGLAEDILAWAREQGLRVRLGTGRLTASFQVGLEDGAARLYPFFMYSSGEVEIQFGLMVSYPYRPFDQLEMRRELRRRLNEIEGVDLPEERLDRRPNFPLHALSEETSRRSFLETIEWALGEARRATGEEFPSQPG